MTAEQADFFHLVGPDKKHTSGIRIESGARSGRFRRIGFEPFRDIDPRELLGWSVREAIKYALIMNRWIKALTLHYLPRVAESELKKGEEAGWDWQSDYSDQVKGFSLGREQILPPGMGLEWLAIKFGLFDWFEIPELLTTRDPEMREWIFLDRKRQRQLRYHPDVSLRDSAEFLMISSRVEIGSGKRKKVAHLPMMDFECQPTSENLGLILERAGTIGIPGFILDSGGSFQFLGWQLVFKEKMSGKIMSWEDFVRNWGSFSLVDPKYVRHVLRTDAGDLRFTTKAECVRLIGLRYQDDRGMVNYSRSVVSRRPARPVPRVVAVVG